MAKLAMNNYPPWYSSLQSIGSMQSIPTSLVAPFSWNFPQPMQIQVTVPTNPNHNYQEISRDFLA